MLTSRDPSRSSAAYTLLRPPRVAAKALLAGALLGAAVGYTLLRPNGWFSPEKATPEASARAAIAVAVDMLRMVVKAFICCSLKKVAHAARSGTLREDTGLPASLSTCPVAGAHMGVDGVGAGNLTRPGMGIGGADDETVSRCTAYLALVREWVDRYCRKPCRDLEPRRHLLQ